jgi:hypothetical protein
MTVLELRSMAAEGEFICVFVVDDELRMIIKSQPGR